MQCKETSSAIEKRHNKLYLEIERRDQIYVKCFHFHFDVAYGKPLYVEFPIFFLIIFQHCMEPARIVYNPRFCEEHTPAGPKIRVDNMKMKV